MTSQNGDAPASHVALCEELDRAESAITAVDRTLTPELWAAARATPAAARTVAASIDALVDLYRKRDAFRERAELATKEGRW